MTHLKFGWSCFDKQVLAVSVFIFWTGSESARERERGGMLKEVVSGFPPFFSFCIGAVSHAVTRRVESVQLSHRFTVLVTRTKPVDTQATRSPPRMLLSSNSQKHTQVDENTVF